MNLDSLSQNMTQNLTMIKRRVSQSFFHTYISHDCCCSTFGVSTLDSVCIQCEKYVINHGKLFVTAHSNVNISVWNSMLKLMIKKMIDLFSDLFISESRWSRKKKEKDKVSFQFWLFSYEQRHYEGCGKYSSILDNWSDYLWSIRKLFSPCKSVKFFTCKYTK